MTSAVTDGIRVSVETFYVSGESDPEKGRWAWAYRITIANEAERAVRLLRRHWIITDAQDRVTEVEGEGVVGEQPVIAPGSSHTYTSGSVMQTSVGTMEGSYERMWDDGEPLRVQIPLFVLGQRASLQ
jgi:ApaG protein